MRVDAARRFSAIRASNSDEQSGELTPAQQYHAAYDEFRAGDSEDWGWHHTTPSPTPSAESSGPVL